MDTPTEPTVSFSLTVKDASKALKFYTNAFGAQEVFRMPAPDGSVAHAEFTIGNTRIYISGEAEEWHAFAMPKNTMASCLFTIMTEDCDVSHERAAKAGAETLSPPEDKFWGARSSVIKDPYGYRWSLNQMTEELSPEEVSKRAEEFFAAMKP